jgi:hypothetical protein
VTRLNHWFPHAIPAVTIAWILLCAPGAAQADWLFSPMIGRTFGADTFGREHATYGGAISWLDEDAFGWEAEFSFSPDFFDANEPLETDRSGSVVTFMGNAIIGAPLGRFRPFFTGGVGLLQMRVSSDAGTFETTTSEFGWNAGVGAFALLGSRVGLRGDLRYLRSFQNQDPSWTRGLAPDIAPGNFDFWRASIGLTVAFPQ